MKETIDRAKDNLTDREVSAHHKLGTWRVDDALAEQLARYVRHGRRRHFAKHSTVYRQGELSTKFYLVEKGLVQISIVKIDGAEVILEFMGPGTICGEGAAFDNLPRFSGAVAVEDSELIEFDAARLHEALAQEPEFASVLLRVMSLKQRVLAVRLEHFSSRQPEERIMDLLTRLKEMFAVPHEDGHLIVTYLTHEQIAAMTGTSRVTVTRTLARLRKQKLIDVKDRRILVRDLSIVDF